MASMKMDNFLKPFRGKDESWDPLWEKFQVLADIQGWDTEVKIMKHLPLFLDGDAFLVYSRMATADKKSKEKVVKKMLESFSLTEVASVPGVCCS